MWGCPVCKTQQADKNAQCAVCGYDVSTDMERYPTLICAQKMMPSNAAKAKAYAAKQNSVLHPKVPVDWIDEAAKTVREFEVRERVLLRYHGEKAEVTLPFGICEIGRGVFAGNAKLERIVIPGSVKLIADGAFRDCKKLGVVDFRVRETPNLSEIAPNAFANCERLAYIWFPHTLKKIENHSFVNCSSLTEITIPGGVECLEESAFEGCSRLRTVILKNGVKELGESAFAGCKNLETVKLPDTLKKIGAYAFSECKELRAAQLPEGLEEVGEWAFGFCRKLAVKKPASLKVEGEKAYRGCCSVEEAENAPAYKWVDAQKIETSEESTECQINIEVPVAKPTEPEKAPEPAKPAEPEMPKAKNIASGICGKNLIWNLDENGLLEIEGTGEMQNYRLFFSSTPWKAYRDKIKQVVIEEGVKSIGAEAFCRCKNLQYVKLPKTLEYIGDYAFKGCKRLSEVQMSAAIREIGMEAFSGCESLTGIELSNELKVLNIGVFAGCKNLRKVILPGGLKKIRPYAFLHCTALEVIRIPRSVEDIPSEAFEDCPVRRYR